MINLNNEINELNSLLEQHYKKEPEHNEFTRAMIVIKKLQRKLKIAEKGLDKINYWSCDCTNDCEKTLKQMEEA